MILNCPQCETRYSVSDDGFPPQGRKVRCTKCGHIWHQPAPEPDIEFVQDEERLVSAADIVKASQEEPTTPVPPMRAPLAPESGSARPAWLGLVLVVAGWAGLIVVVLVIGAAAVRYRQDIAALWPQSASLYAALGMNVNMHGVDFRDVRYQSQTEDGQPVLAVSGVVVNMSAREMPVPQAIRVTLFDADNREIYSWTFAPGVATLKPGQSQKFLTRLSSPPLAARHLEVRFVKDGK